MTSIEYRNNLAEITEEMLEGFFVGWPDPPSKGTHLKILEGSSHVWLAIDPEEKKVVGFINAVSDGVLSAYIPLLEVIPSYQNKGIGKDLVRRMLQSLEDFYMVDLLCDVELQAFYRSLGMVDGTGSLLRNYNRQNGEDLRGVSSKV